jgi:hypothetical protein
MLKPQLTTVASRVNKQYEYIIINEHHYYHHQQEIIYFMSFPGCPCPWARLVYQFVKLCAEVYTFTVSHDSHMPGARRPTNTSKVSGQGIL